MFDISLISSAYAEGGSASTEAAMGNVLFLVLLFAIFYFLLIRPQQKQAKQHKEMIAHLQRGDKVVTGGGIVGKIHRVEDEYAVIEVGEIDLGNKQFSPVRMRVQRATIGAVVVKSAAAADSTDNGSTADKAS
ncbi:MAG: preprotein translocase subunit YajC [Magnetococcales bacterium]|nr:preprotein translocase subunit YajC [Magnetococcales bacterium]